MEIEVSGKIKQLEKPAPERTEYEFDLKIKVADIGVSYFDLGELAEALMKFLKKN